MVDKVMPIVKKINPKSLEKRWFQVLLYHKFHQTEGAPTIVEVASRMNIAENTLTKYINGTNVMPPERITDLVIATGDIEYFCALLRPAGYFPVKIDYEKNNKALSTSDYFTEAFLGIGKVVEMIRETNRDEFTVHKYKKLHSILCQLLSLIYNWDEKFRRMAKP